MATVNRLTPAAAAVAVAVETVAGADATAVAASAATPVLERAVDRSSSWIAACMRNRLLGQVTELSMAASVAGRHRVGRDHGTELRPRGTQRRSAAPRRRVRGAC